MLGLITPRHVYHTQVKALIYVLCLTWVCAAQARSNSHVPLLVDLEWLLPRFKQQHIRVIDARQAKHFAFAHISGAVNIPADDTYATTSMKESVATINHIMELLESSGIDNDTIVVIYDDGGFLDAARVFWVLEVFGHRRVGVLNGGFSTWIEMQLPTDNRFVAYPRKEFVSSFNPQRIATKFATRLAIDNPYISIVDARTQDEFNGKVSRAKRKGHIPNGVNIPVALNFYQQSDFTSLKSNEELIQLYRAAKLEKRVITYCNHGKESAATYFVMRKLGFNVSAYDGSWIEWGNDEKLPIER